MNATDIAADIRRVPDHISKPEEWRIIIPAEHYADVADALDATPSPGRFYHGIDLVFNHRTEVPKVERRTTLEAMLAEVSEE